MLERDSKKEILKKNYFLNKRSDARKKNRFETVKHRCFLLAVVLGLLVIGALYWFSPSSKIYRISVTGNQVLEKRYILENSGISLDDRFLFFSSSKAVKKLESSPFIEKAEVTRRNGRLVEISVTEKKMIGYSYDAGKAVIIFADSSRLEMDRNTMYLIDRIPFISGFTKEQIDYIQMGFKSIESDTINEISEIHRYPFTYDENMMEVIMRDGNYVFTSTFGLHMLKSYYSILSSLDLHDDNVCIYLDEVTNSG
ncbi:MAG: FtsQ-type POTRA domain-containing protein, partial [Erysipelotrichaceae bacterium]|nr:FtsQ-type POTRA domain-containing protein [Erysipelotrichaceae bacterium]